MPFAAETLGEILRFAQNDNVFSGVATCAIRLWPYSVRAG